MYLTARKTALKSLALALILALCAFSGATAQGETTLCVQAKGVVYDMAGGWRAITLSAPVDVFSPDGALLGQVVAGAKQDSGATDTLTLSGVSEVVLKPGEGAGAAGFVYTDETPVTLNAGEQNLATVFAYAQQGLFSVSTVQAETNAPIVGAEFAVLDRQGAEMLRFTTDEAGLYTAEKLLPCGEYTLTQTVAAEGVQPAEPTPFTIGAYRGNEEDITALTVVNQPVGTKLVTSQTAPVSEGAAAIAGSVPETGAGWEVVAASVSGSQKALTDENGGFRFEELDAGDYSIYAPMTKGRTLESGSAWQLTQDGEQLWITVSVKAGEELMLPAIVYTSYASIEGCAYLDSNGDNARTDGEALLAGVPAALDRLEDGAWVEVSSLIANEYGKYSFEGLPAGEYRLRSKTDATGFFIASVGGGTQTDENGARVSDPFTLRDGDRIANGADVGVMESGTLAFTAYLDKNEDGMLGNEARVAGVVVEVMNGDSVLASGTTNENGEWVGSVAPGSWSLRVSLPAGYGFGVAGQQSLIGGVSESTAVSAPVTIAGGATATVAVGLENVGSFSGKVFEDVNNNGIMDESDPGVAGVVLRLEGKRTGNVYELTSDETGLYVFNNLPSDNYIFTATLPEGMLLARYSSTGGDLRSVFSGSTRERVFPVSSTAPAINKNVGVIERGAIAGTVFVDLNYNGVYDEGEPGFEGATAEAIKVSDNESAGRAVSGADGAYSIDGLRSSTYRLRVILPDDGRTIFTKVAQGDNANLFEQRASRRENSIQPVVVESGTATNTLVGIAIGASIEGVVYQDADYSGARNGSEKLYSGVKVQLVAEDGSIAATATTNAKGKYTLGGIMPGRYTVQVQRKPNYGFTRVRPQEETGNCVVELLGDYGVTAPIEVAMGQAITNINAGMLPSATLSGTLFFDENDDGIRDSTERGMTTATVRLLSEDGEIDVRRGVDENGLYFFDGVMPGSYTLTFILPEHCELAQVAQGGNTLEGQGLETTTQPFAITMGENHEYPLVGAVVLGSFEGVAFHDSNANGVMDSDEQSIAGAAVTLTPDRSGLEAQTAESGADGAFSVTGLRPAGYKLTVKLPNDYIISHDVEGAGIALAPANEATADCGWQALTDRAPKLIGAVQPATVSGAVWLDEDRSAARQDGEALLSGLGVELVSEESGMVYARTATTDQGFAFGAVRPGVYRLRFVLPAQSEPAGESGARYIQNGDYMVLGGLQVAEGESLSGLDAGLVSRTSIGGHVWLSENGATTPVSGVTISLYIDGVNSIPASTVTGADGSYQFDGLWPADYFLHSDLPQGTIFVRPSDSNYPSGASVITSSDELGGESDLITLEMAQHQLSRDIILIKPAKVGDQAWLDENKNGLIDEGEPLLPGVTVRLNAGGEAVYETVTDDYGYYLFDDVYPGEYALEAVAYPSLGVTTGVPALRVISSCLTSGDGTLARSDAFSVQSGSLNMDFNLGYVLLDGQELPPLADPPQRDWTGANTPKPKE